MNQAIPLAVALLVGMGASVQTSMLAAIGRARGSTEAGWLSVIGTVTALALLLGVRALRGDPPVLPAPFDRAWVHLTIAAIAGVALVLTTRGLEPYYIVTGLFGLMFIVSAALLAPRLGIALFLSAIIAGQLVGALTMDHIGAFGGQVRHINGLRLAGVAALFLGVVLVRGGQH